MKLSDAVILGSTFVELKPSCWTNCVLGAAARAVGIEPVCDAILDYWPWLDSDYCQMNMVKIVTYFDEFVCKGDMTLDELVKIIRQMEPACGECNSKGCCCSRLVSVHNAAQSGLQRADLPVFLQG